MKEMLNVIMGLLESKGDKNTSCRFDERLTYIVISKNDRNNTMWVINEAYGKFYISNAWGIRRRVTTQDVVNYL